MPRGVGVDPPSLRAGIQYVGQRKSTHTLDQQACFAQVVDEKVEVRLLLSVLTRPRRRAVARHSMKREAADGVPAESQPLGVALRLGQVEDLLPEPGQPLGVVALQNELSQPAYRHGANLRGVAGVVDPLNGRSAHRQHVRTSQGADVAMVARVAELGSQGCALPSLSTGRLTLRAVSVADLDLMVDLNSDPAVMTYIQGRAATPAETAAEWQQRLDHQSDVARGLGYWAGFDAGTFVGWWSASSFEAHPEISGIGYRLRSTEWGRGLATEGAEAMIRQAFSCRDVDRVVASTMAANTGSRRVLEKLGLTRYASWAAAPDRQQVLGWKHGEVAYELNRAGWTESIPDEN